LGVITISGYLLTSTGYANSMDNFKTYYGNLLKHLELPHLTAHLEDKKIQNPVPVKKTNLMAEPAHHRKFEKASHVVGHRGSPKMTEKRSLQSNKEKPFSIEKASHVVGHRENPKMTDKQDFQGNKKKPIAPEDFDLTIKFGYNTNVMPSGAYRSLDKIAANMLQDQSVEIIVTGHTSGTGRSKYNRKLSVFRANIVKSYLVGKGVDPDRIRATGMGEKNPVMPNTSKQGREANRRVEIKLVPQKG
jgi:outer membrane protein OmpA-like peptidoglycan-associated protein